MKLSNKILLAFIGVIFLYTILASAEVRFRGTNNYIEDHDLIVESLPVEDYKYLIIKDLKIPVSIHKSGQTRIEISSINGNSLNKVSFNIKNDSLIIDSSDFIKEKHLFLAIYLPNSANLIKSQSENIKITALDLDSLTVFQKGGRVTVEEGVKLDWLNLRASKNAKINMNSASVENIQVNIENSSVSINQKVSTINGIVRDQSRLLTRSFSHISIDRDESSKLIVN